MYLRIDGLRQWKVVVSIMISWDFRQGFWQNGRQGSEAILYTGREAEPGAVMGCIEAC